MDRHSGDPKNSVKPQEVKGGSGSRNWGNVQDDLEGQLAPALDETLESEPKSGEDAAPETPLEVK